MKKILTVAAALALTASIVSSAWAISPQPEPPDSPGWRGINPQPEPPGIHYRHRRIHPRPAHRGILPIPIPRPAYRGTLPLPIPRPAYRVHRVHRGGPGRTVRTRHWR